MRAPNDERLAREAEDIDLILGGHDHEYYGAVRIGKKYQSYNMRITKLMKMRYYKF